jgi:thioredoxin 1
MEGKAKIVKLDVQESSEIAIEFKVAMVPTLIIFKDGTEQERLVGGQPEAALAELLNKYL